MELVSVEVGSTGDHVDPDLEFIYHFSDGSLLIEARGSTAYYQSDLEYEKASPYSYLEHGFKEGQYITHEHLWVFIDDPRAFSNGPIVECDRCHIEISKNEVLDLVAKNYVVIQ